MSPTVESISPVPIEDPHLPIALRPAVDFSALRGSVFDDPGDEKSWHVSQRSEDLLRYYEGRDPSWYASAVAPFAGAERVLDLGCGPGLALRALRELGCSTIMGVDRWPAFAAEAGPGTPIVAHDLTLPMPFIGSASFDGVLSHYALDYVSPICARQVLREAHRVLAPGGLLVVYLAAVGLAAGDESRTVAYSPAAMRTLLAEAGFGEIEVEPASGGRNTVAKARASVPAARPVPASPQAMVDGDTQLSASFRAVAGLRFELTGDAREASFSVELPPARAGADATVAVCARALRSRAGGTLAQLWVWRGLEPVAVECAKVEFAATRMCIVCDAPPRHVACWSPTLLSLEPPGSAHVRPSELAPGGEMSDAERASEGRQVVVEPAGGPPLDADRLGRGRNRFRVRWGSSLDPATLDREWLAGRLSGVAATASELRGEGLRELLLWAGWRQAPLYLSGADWQSVRAACEHRRDEMLGPVVAVDPTLDGGGSGAPVPAGIAAFVTQSQRLHLLLARDTLERSGEAEIALVLDRLLLAAPGGSAQPVVAEAAENLRHLTERTMLIRLRQARGHGWADVGRRPA